MERPSIAGVKLTDAQRERLEVILGRPVEQRGHSRALSTGNREDREEPSAREIQVLWCVARGDTNAQIGRALHVSEETVKSHVRHLLEKLKARNRSHAVAIGFEQGYLDVLDNFGRTDGCPT
jgi:DNA-binding CsgD family transcriptional regulator